MDITLRTCRCCGRIFPLLKETNHDFCSECFYNQQIMKEEFDWKNLTFGYSCPNGKCDL